LASVTGYYSIRYGVGGTEATFDRLLRGTTNRTEQEAALDDLLHRPLEGQDVTLTINLPAQVAADVAVGEREGAVVVMDIETGAVLVMSSRPTYDPNQLDEMWDVLREDETAPLLNRATQGLFPLGDVARLIGLIGLYESGLTLPAEPATAPLNEMLAPLGETGYLATAHQLGLGRALVGIRSQSALFPDFDDKKTVRDLAPTPLHLARIIAALELEGGLLDPILSVSEQQSIVQPAIRPDTARRVRGLLTQVDEQLIGLSGLATPQETGKNSLSWFVGLAPTVASAPVLTGTVPGELILDPAKIPAATSTPSRPATSLQDRARYVVVAVVVIADESEKNLAFRIARAPLQVLLEN
jgi:hypothetical protein